MRRRLLLQVIVASGLAIAGSGCTMIDHSNTMLFGTNTAVGVQVGVDTNNVPSVNIGYRRQEAVFLPLQSNLKDDKGNFVPCPGTTTVTAELTTSCKFLAKNGEGQAEDSYSVLASFGADIKGGTKDGGAEASVGLAQYFATGTAAQLLALKGGAAVVAVGKAAEMSAETAPPAGAVRALVGSPETVGSAHKLLDTWAGERKELADYLKGLSAAEFSAQRDKISAAAGDTLCGGLKQAECVKMVGDPSFNDDIDDFYTAYKKVVK